GLAQTQPTRKADITTFQCIRQGTGYATVARRGSRQTGAMITWNSTAFGPKFTPQKRCELVSQRLSKAVISSGGKLSTLKFCQESNNQDINRTRLWFWGADCSSR
ncbi:MAG: COP23 domain-containing protein, partial [Nostoc sp.]